ncbi:LysR substrate-binding domain-containing protein [Elongatibacter sediminis]|uniref:LysR substrate-binding domain-containing protein n=1 Tax=Elongatibacter sediminis TaxID=3119006 RepID=A0AAW9RFP1_9GAMM
MKLQQLRYLVAIVDNGMNITQAAQALFTSQPGVSKQVKLLEDELSLPLFIRKGKSLDGLTDAGEEVVRRSRRILTEVENIRSVSRDMAGQLQGELIVATTHTQARYVLPDLLEGFQRAFPGISVSLVQGTSDRIAKRVQDQEADFAIASGRSELFSELITLPIYHWERTVLVPHEHELASLEHPTLADLARYPIISYTHSFDPGSDQAVAFERDGSRPNVVFTAEDPDVIKAYVRKEMGIGIVACMAYDKEKDSDLLAIDATRLFPSCTTWIGFRRDRFLRDYMFGFLELMVPGLDRRKIEELVEQAEGGRGPAYGESLAALNNHPSIGNRFSNCCNGEFNL